MNFTKSQFKKIDSPIIESVIKSYDFEKNKQAAFWLAEFWNPKLKGMFRWREDLEVIQPKEESIYIVYEDKNKARNMFVFEIKYDIGHDAFKRGCNIELKRARIIR